MSASALNVQQRRGFQRAKDVAKRMLLFHIPVGAVNRPAVGVLYQLHVTARAAVGWSLRFFWYEPLFRSQCHSVGDRFSMEQLPYLVGRGQILIGSNVRFSGKPSFAFNARHCPSPLLTIGDHCFLGHNCAITVAQQVKIGNHCLIAGGVRISDFDGHPIDAAERRRGVTSPSDRVVPVTIGDDVWLGHSAVILKGVTIGDRAIVGARSVVTGDVDADTVVAGNPARVVKSLKPS